MPIQAVLFDFIGTTVLETTPNTIADCFEKAFQDNGIQVSQEFINANRGKNKIEIIQLAVNAAGMNERTINIILNSFERNIELNMSNFCAVPELSRVFDELRSAGIKIGIGTGLTRDSFEIILAHVKWSKADFDYTATSEEIGKGRPHPDMIFDMMKKLQITDPQVILKVGDTIADIQEGKNAGVITMAILSGTQHKALLEKEKPDFICDRLEQMLNFL